jgi:hypothetical protein
MTKNLHKQIFAFGTLIFCLEFSTLHAQDAITITGGNASGSGGSASYSIGQVVYTTNSGANGSVAQGVQQAYEIFVVSGLEDAIGIQLNLSAYPNPTSDVLYLKVDPSPNRKFQSMSYQLFDLNGKLLQKEKLVSNETGIDLKYLVAATYLLRVTDKNQEVKTFKIIKK